MGQLLALLKGGAKEEEPVDVPVNFNATPTDAETEIYNAATALINVSPSILESLKSYTGCGDAIRQAISNPGKAAEDAAWEIVCPAVMKLKEMYEFALQLEELTPRLVKFLASGEASASIAKCQATTKKLADILDFASQFDALKMSNPNVQNDFSYYRRTVSRMKMNNAQMIIIVTDDLANKMSLFFAHSNPVSKALIDAINGGVSNRTCDPANTTDVFSILAGISYNKVAKKRADGDEIQFYLRVLVTSILIFDHVDSAGAFSKGSRINIKAFVKTIQANGGSNTEALLNALRFSSQHLNDESTPKATKLLLVAS